MPHSWVTQTDHTNAPFAGDPSWSHKCTPQIGALLVPYNPQKKVIEQKAENTWVRGGSPMSFLYFLTCFYQQNNFSKLARDAKKPQPLNPPSEKVIVEVTMINSCFGNTTYTVHSLDRSIPRPCTPQIGTPLVPYNPQKRS